MTRLVLTLVFLLHVSAIILIFRRQISGGNETTDAVDDGHIDDGHTIDNVPSTIVIQDATTTDRSNVTEYQCQGWYKFQLHYQGNRIHDQYILWLQHRLQLCSSFEIQSHVECALLEHQVLHDESDSSSSHSLRSRVHDNELLQQYKVLHIRHWSADMRCPPIWRHTVQLCGDRPGIDIRRTLVEL